MQNRPRIDRSDGISRSNTAVRSGDFSASAILNICILIATFVVFFDSSTAIASITGTGDCSSVGNPLGNPQIADYTCTGNLTIDGGSVETLSGDITLTVNGTLTVTGAGSSLVLSPSTTYVRIVATQISVGSGAFVDSNGRGCPASQSYDPSIPGCVNKGVGVTAGFGEGADNTNNGGGGGGGYGGRGGSGTGNPVPPAGFAYGSADLVQIMPGSGGGNGSTGGNSGGRGGGAIKIEVSGTLALDGTIRANGLNGIGNTSAGGGGSGGSIHIIAGTISGLGSILANGGNNAGIVAGGGGGAGGRVRIECNICLSFTPSTLQAMGGAPGSGAGVGQAGSVFLIGDNPPSGLGPEDDYTVGGGGSIPGPLNLNSLTAQAVGNSGNATRDGGPLSINGDLTVGAPFAVDSGQLTVTGNITASSGTAVGSGGLLRMVGDKTLTTPTLTVDGTLILDADGTSIVQPYSRVIATTITVHSGGIISADGAGCGASLSYNYTVSPPICQNLTNIPVLPGFGEGGNNSNAGGGGGGGYGGAGGAGNAIVPADGHGGNVYGDNILTSFMLGSGGGNNNIGGELGGSGGGAVKMEVSGTLTNDGTISVSGVKGQDGANRSAGGGSGGSLQISISNLGGTGQIRANGGGGGDNTIGGNLGGGGGGGGRVRIDLAGTNNYAGICSADGGPTASGGLYGAAGTVAFRLRPDGTLNGNGVDIFGAFDSGAGGQALLRARVGRPTFYNLGIHNNDPDCSTETQSYLVSWTPPGAGWTVSVIEATTEHPSSFVTTPLRPDQQGAYLIKVIPPLTATVGEYDVIVNIQSQTNPALVDSVLAQVVVGGADGMIDGNGDDIYGAVGTGSGGASSRTMFLDASTSDPNDYATVSYALTVQNESGGPESYALTWTVPSGWTTTIQELATTCAAGTCSATTPPINGGTASVYTFRVTPPSGATTQTAILNIVSTTEPAFSEDSVTITAVVPGGPPLITAPSSLSVVAPAGATGEHQLNLTWVDGSNNETGFQVERTVAGPGAVCSAQIGYALITTVLRNSTQTTSTGDPLYLGSTGLASSTSYCYRVRAFGSLGYSSYRYPTIPADTSVSTNSPAAGDTTPPGAVTDLVVNPESQRPSSIGLTWTAPPDDSTISGVGQAASYDLRYSTSPIVDGAPGPGRIDFDSATAVPGLSPPKPAGGLEISTVRGLNPNTVYYFALKALDEAGNLSAMSNVAGGDNPTDGRLAGRTALRTGFNLISVPLQPPPAPTCGTPASVPGDDPACVFEDDIGGTINLGFWISSGLTLSDGCYATSPITGSSCAPQVGITAVTPGQGYFLIGGSNDSVIDVPEFSTGVTVGTLCGVPNSYALPVELGWNIVGDPFPNGVSLATVYVRQNGSDASCVDYATAVANGWVGSTLYDFNGSGYDWVIFSSATLEPWKGYWLWVRNNDVIDGNSYELIIPTPP